MVVVELELVEFHVLEWCLSPLFFCLLIQPHFKSKNWGIINNVLEKNSDTVSYSVKNNQRAIDFP